ncbi:hypothetical protein CTI12_AA145800 [Artemisia annua]|uniref:Uncharacterized protein n=1 Tax=Artemisia annua TaxID=35608 RepID=A0A2U1PJH9_ARTAN|nr:hypothetical protein CTI12_AA145800 [Artemisia annua]
MFDRVVMLAKVVEVEDSNELPNEGRLPNAKQDLELNLTYVGYAEDETYDQVLESVLVRPINVGNYPFVFEFYPQNTRKVMVTCVNSHVRILHGASLIIRGLH